MPLLELNELETMSPLFRGKCGNSFARGLMRILSIDKVNVLYDRNITHAGPAFARNVLKDLGVRYDVLNPENLDSIPEGSFITISNHPYGGIDGIILVDLFGHLFGDYKVMVNKFLDRVETLKDNFICVTPTGKERTVPTDDSVKGIKTAMRHVLEGGALGLFPSGAVSDLSLKDLCVRDRVWQEPVIRLIQKLHVPVLPVTFLDRNSDFYYSLGLIDWKVRLLRLPSEVFNKKDKMVRVAIGKIITPETILEHHYKGDLNSFLRSKVYEFKK